MIHHPGGTRWTEDMPCRIPRCSALGSLARSRPLDFHAPCLRCAHKVMVVLDEKLVHDPLFALLSLSHFHFDPCVWLVSQLTLVNATVPSCAVLQFIFIASAPFVRLSVSVLVSQELVLQRQENKRERTGAGYDRIRYMNTRGHAPSPPFFFPPPPTAGNTTRALCSLYILGASTF